MIDLLRHGARRGMWFALGWAIVWGLSISSVRAAPMGIAPSESTSATYLWCANGGPGGTAPAFIVTNPYCASSMASAMQLRCTGLSAGANQYTQAVQESQVTNQFQGNFYCLSPSNGKCYNSTLLNGCPSTPGYGVSAQTITLYAQCKFGATLAWNSMPIVCPAAPEEPCKDKKGIDQSTGIYLLGTSPTAAFANVTCSGSCEVVFSGQCPAKVSVISGVSTYYCEGRFTADGAACVAGTPTAPATTTPADDTCPAGQTLVKGPPKTCETTPDPACENQWETRVGGICTPNACPSGYSRDAISGACVPAACPTGQIHDPITGACNTDPSPPPPGSPPDPGHDPVPPPPPPDHQAPKTFCELNPSDPACDKSAFSSSCNVGAATTSCKGDPVQCAQALAATQLACDFEPNAGAMVALRATIGNAYTPAEFAAATTRTYDIGSVLDFTDKDTGAGCPADKTFSAMGASYTIPMAPLCALAGYVKFFLTFAATVIALRLAFGGA